MMNHRWMNRRAGRRRGRPQGFRRNQRWILRWRWKQTTAPIAIPAAGSSVNFHPRHVPPNPIHSIKIIIKKIISSIEWNSIKSYQRIVCDTRPQFKSIDIQIRIDWFQVHQGGIKNRLLPWRPITRQDANQIDKIKSDWIELNPMSRWWKIQTIHFEIV